MVSQHEEVKREDADSQDLIKVKNDEDYDPNNDPFFQHDQF